MSSSYKQLYGVDWPVDMSNEFIGMTIGKKWREFKSSLGIEFKDPWVPLLKSARSLLSESDFKISSWTEEHFHDFVMEQRVVTWGCAASGKSNDYALLLLLDWLVDPNDTVTLLGSTTKEDLKKRSWEAVVRYHNLLKRSNKFLVPGIIPSRSQSLINARDDSLDESVTEKAGIHGQALNEDGRMQGAHAKYVRIVVDELAEIKDHNPILVALTNLQVGADLKFIGLANPAAWENASCQYCIPVGGIKSVDVNTPYWRSTRGVFVRHHDGLKSPCVLHPELSKTFPFLISQANIDSALQLADGNMDAPVVWQMVRGFPPPSGIEAPVVLDPKIAHDQRITEPPVPQSSIIACSGGADPAWSEGGDGAIYQIVKIRQSAQGMYPVLDFTDMYRLRILASSELPVTQQLRDQILAVMRNPGYYSPPLRALAVDASANQGLADDLDIYIGQGTSKCLHVNFSNRASTFPIRANDDVPAKDRYHDRATESWCVLSEFCKAGMVRGLSSEAVRALTTRRFATLPKSNVPKFPLQLEPKEEFKKRFKHSPDETDAAALAALAAKEVLGVLPFGWFSPAKPIVQSSTEKASALPATEELSEGGNGDALDELDIGG